MSILCAIHCLATPLILVSLPAAAKHSESAEACIVGVSLLIGLCAIRTSYRRNGALLSRPGIGAGLGAIGGGRRLRHGPAETILAFSGAGILVAAPLFNCRECREGCVGHPRKRTSAPFLLLASIAVCGTTTSVSAQPLGIAPSSAVVVDVVRTFIGLPYRLGGDSL